MHRANARAALSLERIARRAHGADRVLGARHLDRLAQAADVDVDRPQFDVAPSAPDAVKQLAAIEDATGACLLYTSDAADE